MDTDQKSLEVQLETKEKHQQINETPVAYGNKAEQTFDGETALLNCFGDSDHRVKAVWTLISTDAPISDYNLQLRYNNNEQKNFQGNVKRQNSVVSGSETVQFPANWNQAEVSMTGTANLRVSLTPPAFSVKIIPPISAICNFNKPLVQSPLFYRFGIDYESPTRLNRQAEDAERSRIGIYGVSVSKDPNIGPAEKSVADTNFLNACYR